MRKDNLVESSDGRYVWVKDGPAWVRVRRVQGADISVSSPPVVIPYASDASKIAREFEGATSGVGMSKNLAREDHLHSLGKNSRVVKNFGYMTTWAMSAASPAPPTTAFLCSKPTFPAMKIWTIEGWVYNKNLSGDTGQNGFFGLFSNGANAAGDTGGIGDPNSFGFDYNGHAVIAGVDTGLNGAIHPPGDGALHSALCYDGTTVYLFVNGTLNYFGQGGTFATASGAIPAGLSFGLSDHSAFTSLNFDEIRISNVCRYTADFAVPTVPFVADADTVALYHFDDFPPGQALEILSTGTTPLTTYPNITCDDSAAGNYPLEFSYVQTAGSLNNTTMTLGGAVSGLNGAANNGILGAASVTSLAINGGNPQTGDVSVTLGLTKISEVSLGGAQATIDFPTIPQTYKSLFLLYRLRGDTAAGNISIFMRFNGDAATNYDWWGFYLNNGAMANTGLAVTNQIKVGTMPAANSNQPTSAAHGRVDFPMYTDTALRHSVIAHNRMIDGNAASSYIEEFGGDWQTLVAITDITLIPAAGNFVAGSYAALYGEA